MKQHEVLNGRERISPPRVERLSSVIARTGLSRTTIWRRAGEDFPAPVRLGPNSIAWVVTEVDAWLQGKIDARG